MNKKVNKAIFIAKISNTVNVWDVLFGVDSADSPSKWFSDSLSGTEGEKQSYGTYTFNVDVSKKDFND